MYRYDIISDYIITNYTDNDNISFLNKIDYNRFNKYYHEKLSSFKNGYQCYNDSINDIKKAYSLNMPVICEFGLENEVVIPFLYALCMKGLLLNTSSVKGMEPLYYFNLNNHKIVDIPRKDQFCQGMIHHHCLYNL